MGILTKQSAGNQDDVLTGYIFDIFSKYGQVILKAQLRQIVDIFIETESDPALAQDLHRCETLTKPEFQQLCKRIGIRLHYFSKISTLFEVEFGMQSLGHERELEVIRIALDGEMDLKLHFQSKLAVASSEDCFYLLTKSFWQKWAAYVGLPRKDSFGVQLEKSNSMGKESERARRPLSIQNEFLRLSSSQQRLKPNLLYGKDYVIVPPRVWKAFTCWYGKSYALPRKVIIYPMSELSLRAASQLTELQNSKGSLNEQQIVQSLD